MPIWLGRGGIGDSLIRGFACGKANLQVIIQLTGGTLTKALALHMGAVLPTMTGHSVNLDDQYEEDITERIPVIEGFSPVPEGPGLGIEVDEDALARVAANQPTEIPKHVGVLHMPGGHKIYTPSFASVSRLTGREEGTIRDSSRNFGTMMAPRNLPESMTGCSRRVRLSSSSKDSCAGKNGSGDRGFHLDLQNRYRHPQFLCRGAIDIAKIYLPFAHLKVTILTYLQLQTVPTL